MNTPESHTPKNNRILMIIAASLVVAICAAAVFVVIKTVLKDNAGISGGGNGETPNGTTAPTVDPVVEGEKLKNTIAIKIGQHNINAVELNYYYVEMVQNFCQEYYYYIYYYGMIDPNKPLNQQVFDKETGETWADYFLGVSKDGLKSTYLLCDQANKNGYSLSESDQKYLATVRETIERYATQYKYADVNSYLVDIYGYGADIDSYMAYSERALLADSYYRNYADSLTYTGEELREFEGDKAHTYNSYTYATYYLDPAKFLTGGTEDSDGKITYTDEQKAAALKAAEEVAKSLNGSNCQDLDAFNSLILGLDINSNLTSVKVGENTDQLYAAIDTRFQEWLSSSDRAYGDVAYIAKTSTNANKEEVVEGYYIIWFGGINDNMFQLKDVRHILVMFKNAEGKTYSDGITSFTPEQKEAAKLAAEQLLEVWKSGEMTEDSFAALATKKTEDTGSAATGGLYQNIYPGQMVEGFEKWCYDPDRQIGDTGLVESVYGYHIMFFVGDSDTTYRDYMVSYNLRNEDLSKWHEALMATVELEEICLDYCKLDMKLSG